MRTDSGGRWTPESVHIAGAVWSSRERRGLALCAAAICDELSGGEIVPVAEALIALGRTGERSKPGDVYVLAGGGLYLIAPARERGHKPWTLIAWTQLSEWGLRTLRRGAA